MRPKSLFGLLVGLLAFAPVAWAGDDDDDDPLGGDDIPEPQHGDDDDGDQDAKPPTNPDADVQFDDDTFEEDEEFGAKKEGQDDARLYREASEKMEGMTPDEEVLAWEKYLKKYPNSLFKSRIDARIEELNAAMFDTRLGTSSEGGLLDAGKAELRFAQPINLNSIDPRTKLHLGVAIGLPGYLSYTLDYEHQILRNLSVHGGLKKEYTGANLEVGGRYALVKSARTNTLVTGILDLHVNTLPVFLGIHPTIGAGKRFDVLEGLDVMAQAGVDLPLGYGDRFAPFYDGGLNVSVAPADNLRVFGEVATSIRDPFNDTVESSFRFNTFTFGLKFVARKGKTTDLAEIGANASLPVLTSYWSYHYGSIGADGHIYFK